MDTTPVSLLERLRKSDDSAAWTRFSELCTPLLFRWARRMGLQEQDAADLVQEVFTMLIVKMPEFTALSKYAHQPDSLQFQRHGCAAGVDSKHGASHRINDE